MILHMGNQSGSQMEDAGPPTSPKKSPSWQNSRAKFEGLGRQVVRVDRHKLHQQDLRENPYHPWDEDVYLPNIHEWMVDFYGKLVGKIWKIYVQSSHGWYG